MLKPSLSSFLIAYANCVNDPYCAANTIQNYMSKFGQDCNGDGGVDCYDYAAIHKLGGYGCKGELSYQYQSALDKCLTTFSPLDVRTSGWVLYLKIWFTALCFNYLYAELQIGICLSNHFELCKTLWELHILYK